MRVPLFRALDDDACRALLKQHHVGRLAFLDHGRVDIEPLHYVFLGEWLFCRTTEGAKTHALRHTPYVAFEVDEVHGIFEWRSVVVRGTVYFLPDVGAPVEEEQYQRAVTALRRFLPGTLEPDDPVPMRTLVFGINIDELSGRTAASPAAGAAQRAKAGVKTAPPSKTTTKAAQRSRTTAKASKQNGKRRPRSR